MFPLREGSLAKPRTGSTTILHSQQPENLLKGIALKEPAAEEMFEDAERDEEEVETTPLSSCRGAFMDLLEVSFVVLLEEPIEEALFLWIPGDPNSGLCVICSAA